MAQRRMMSLEVVDTDAFLDMPTSSQLLYFHLNARADDDGFIANPKKIMRMLGTNADDLKVLITKKFIIAFEDGVCVIKHWRINNFIRKDIYKETKYLDLKRTLFIRANGAYTQNEDEYAKPLPDGHFKLEDINVNDTLTKRQLRLGKVRKGKVRSGDKHSLSSNKVSYSQRDLELAQLLFERIVSNTPTFKEPNLESWANHIRLMRERDNRTPEQVEFVIKWCQESNFWQANILSTKKLREKFDTLVAQIKRNADKDKIKRTNVIL